MRHVDRQDRSRLARRLTAALLTSATMAAHAAPPPPPELVPRDAARDRAFAAAGIQVYSCEYDGNHRLAWTFQHPEATLYDAAGVAVIKHGAGPAWEAQDGSRIVGEKLADAPSPNADSIAQLLLSTRASAGGSRAGGMRARVRVRECACGADGFGRGGGTRGGTSSGAGGRKCGRTGGERRDTPRLVAQPGATRRGTAARRV